MKNQEQIGLNFKQLSDVKHSIREKFEKSAAFNCGDFDEIFLAIVNETIAKLRQQK